MALMVDIGKQNARFVYFPSVLVGGLVSSLQISLQGGLSDKVFWVISVSIKRGLKVCILKCLGRLGMCTHIKN